MSPKPFDFRKVQLIYQAEVMANQRVSPGGLVLQQQLFARAHRFLLENKEPGDETAAAHPRPAEEEPTQFLVGEQLGLRENNCGCRTTYGPSILGDANATSTPDGPRGPGGPRHERVYHRPPHRAAAPGTGDVLTDILRDGARRL